jgi:hypothetical protein
MAKITRQVKRLVIVTIIILTGLLTITSPVLSSRIVDNVAKGRKEFDINRKYKFGGLHEYENAQKVINENLIDSTKYVLKDNPVKWKPDGVTEIKYRTLTDPPTMTRTKSIAPKGTTEADFIEAGALLKKDFRMGNVAEMVDDTDPLYDRALSQFIFSKNKYMIDGNSYSIQGYRTITTPSQSSWWFVEEIPKGFK